MNRCGARRDAAAGGAEPQGRPPASARAGKSHAEARPDAVALARRLRRKRPKGGQRSLRDIAAELAAAGYVNERGRRYDPKSVASMLAVRMGEGAR